MYLINDRIILNEIVKGIALSTSLSFCINHVLIQFQPHLVQLCNKSKSIQHLTTVLSSAEESRTEQSGVIIHQFIRFPKQQRRKWQLQFNKDNKGNLSRQTTWQLLNYNIQSNKDTPTASLCTRSFTVPTVETVCLSYALGDQRQQGSLTDMDQIKYRKLFLLPQIQSSNLRGLPFKKLNTAKKFKYTNISIIRPENHFSFSVYKEQKIIVIQVALLSLSSFCPASSASLNERRWLETQLII